MIRDARKSEMKERDNVRSEVAFEVRYVGAIEPDLRDEDISSSTSSRYREIAHKSGVEPDISLGQLVSRDELFSTLEHLLESIERLEERDHVVLVSFLSSRESGFVDTLSTRSASLVRDEESQ